MLRHILVPLDGSQLAEKALDYTRQIAGSATTVTLLVAIEPPEHVVYGMYGQTGIAPVASVNPTIDYDAIMDNMLEQSRRYLKRVADEIRPATSTVETKVKIGTPADVIVETAIEEGVDTIVMPTHGRSGLSRWLLGSVTQKVLSAAPCPVYVIPPPHKEK